MSVYLSITTYAAYNHGKMFTFQGDITSTTTTYVLPYLPCQYTSNQAPSTIAMYTFQQAELPITFNNIKLQSLFTDVSSSYQIKYSYNPPLYASISAYFNQALLRAGIENKSSKYFEETSILIDMTGNDNPYQFIQFKISLTLHYQKIYRDQVVDQLYHDLRHETSILIPFMRKELIQQLVLQEKGYDVIEQAPQSILDYIDFLHGKRVIEPVTPTFNIDTATQYFKYEKFRDDSLFDRPEPWITNPSLINEVTFLDEFSNMFKRIHAILYKVNDERYIDQPGKGLLANLWDSGNYTIESPVDIYKHVNKGENYGLINFLQASSEYALTQTPLNIFAVFPEIFLRRAYNTIDYFSGKDKRTTFQVLMDPNSFTQLIKDQFAVTNAMFSYHYLYKPVFQAAFIPSVGNFLNAMKSALAYTATTTAFDTYSKTVGPYVVDQALQSTGNQIKQYTGDIPTIEDYVKYYYKSDQIQTLVNAFGYLGAYGSALAAYKAGFLNTRNMRTINAISQSNIVTSIIPAALSNIYRLIYGGMQQDIPQIAQGIDAGMYALVQRDRFWNFDQDAIQRALVYMIRSPQERQRIFDTGRYNPRHLDTYVNSIMGRLQRVLQYRGINIDRDIANFGINQLQHIQQNPEQLEAYANSIAQQMLQSGSVAASVRQILIGQRRAMNNIHPLAIYNPNQSIKQQLINWISANGLSLLQGAFGAAALAYGIDGLRQQRPRNEKLFDKYLSNDINWPLDIYNGTQQVTKNDYEHAIQLYKQDNPLTNSTFKLDTPTNRDSLFDKVLHHSPTILTAGAAALIFQQLIANGIPIAQAKTIASNIENDMSKAEAIHSKTVGRSNPLKMTSKGRQIYKNFIRNDFGKRIENVLEDEDEYILNRKYKKRSKRTKNIQFPLKRARFY